MMMKLIKYIVLLRRRMLEIQLSYINKKKRDLDLLSLKKKTLKKRCT